MTNPEQQIAAYLESSNPEIASLAQELRQHLKKETKPTFELVAKSTNSVNIGYGFTRKAWDCFCAIIVYSKHINISFPSGASIPDPEGLLHGTGKRVRHIKIKVFKDIKTPAVKKLLQEASINAMALLDEIPDRMDSVQTFVKPI